MYTFVYVYSTNVSLSCTLAVACTVHMYLYIPLCLCVYLRKKLPSTVRMWCTTLYLLLGSLPLPVFADSVVYSAATGWSLGKYSTEGGFSVWIVSRESQRGKFQNDIAFLLLPWFLVWNICFSHVFCLGLAVRSNPGFCSHVREILWQFQVQSNSVSVGTVELA
jgi:hypothetical protein